MLAVTTLFALVGALGVAATPSSSTIHHILSRQLQSAIPAACQDQCTQAQTIYNACNSGDQTTCLTVCNTDTFGQFVDCFSCVLAQTPGVEQSEYDALQAAIGQLEQACQATGTTVSGSLTPFASLTGASTATATDDSGDSTASATLSSDSLSFTSAGGNTIAAGGDSMTGAATPGASGTALPIGGASTTGGSPGSISSAAGALSSAANGASPAARSSSSARSVSASAASSSASATGSAGAALGVKGMLGGWTVGMGAGMALVGVLVGGLAV